MDDLSALNASVWTEWKAAMLQELYQRTSEVLRRNLTGSQIDEFHRAFATFYEEYRVEGGPIVLVSMVVGLTISIFQAATQINEATLTFVPKLVLVAVVLVILGPSMVNQLVEFTQYVFQVAAGAAR